MPLADTLAVQTAARRGGRAARRPARRGRRRPRLGRRRQARRLLVRVPGEAGRLVGGGHAGRRPPGPADGVGEVDGVDRRGAAGVVVEVDEDVLVGRPGGGQPVGPELQRLRAVAPVLEAVVEAQVAPVGGPPERRDRLLVAVGPAQRRAVALQQRADLVGPPALVPRLDGDPGAGRELRQALAEQVGVGLQRRRQLQQDRVEPVLRARPPAPSAGRPAPRARAAA